MFTGLVQTTGRIDDLKPSGAGVRLVIQPEPAMEWRTAAGLGDSISVSGACLTVADILIAERKGDPARLAFDVVPETLRLTSLGKLALGDRVNLEASVTAATLMGGHFVQGHVDGLATIERVQTQGEWRVALRVPPGLMPFMTPKGSVCLDGVSLTLASVDPAESIIEVALIPTTLQRTTLSEWSPGEAVNVEADVIAKTVVNYLTHFAARK
jgi:riboflavin synthase